MKHCYDNIYRRVPPNHANRLAVAGDVAALAPNVVIWNANKNAADALWAVWGPIYTAAEAAGAAPYAYPAGAGNQHTAMTNMAANFAAFSGVAEMIIDNGLRASKRALMTEHYVQAGINLDGTLTNAFLEAADNEDLAAFKLRARTLVLGYIRPGQAAWLAGVGYNNDNPIVRQLAFSNPEMSLKRRVSGGD
jgi:hypothetical protein